MVHKNITRIKTIHKEVETKIQSIIYYYSYYLYVESMFEPSQVTDYEK